MGSDTEICNTGEDSRPRPAFKLWLETDEGYVYGPGVHALLQKVEETGTLKDAAEALEMSYRFAWGLIKKAERKIGDSLIEAHKGGRSGGGGTELTDLGRRYIEEFNQIRKKINTASKLGGRQSKSTLEVKVIEIIPDGDYDKMIVEAQNRVKMEIKAPRSILEAVGKGDKLVIEVTTSVRSLEDV